MIITGTEKHFKPIFRGAIFRCHFDYFLWLKRNTGLLSKFCLLRKTQQISASTHHKNLNKGLNETFEPLPLIVSNEDMKILSR